METKWKHKWKHRGWPNSRAVQRSRLTTLSYFSILSTLPIARRQNEVILIYKMQTPVDRQELAALAKQYRSILLTGLSSEDRGELFDGTCSITDLRSGVLFYEGVEGLYNRPTIRIA
jgi:hypothetical protein